MSTASSDSRRDFHEKLILSVFDKLVLGLLIVLAGFVLNIVLQNRQSNQATRAEIARLRVAQVAEVWGALDSEQQAIDHVGNKLSGLAQATAQFDQAVNAAQSRNGVPADPADRQEAKARVTALERLYTQIEQSEKTARSKEKHVFQVLHKDRFWIGEKIYPSYIAYATKERELLKTYENVGLGALQLQIGEPAQGTARERADYQRWLEGQQETLKTKKADLLKARLDVFAVIEKLS